jgi:hypothetical protein
MSIAAGHPGMLRLRYDYATILLRFCYDFATIDGTEEKNHNRIFRIARQYGQRRELTRSGLTADFRNFSVNFPEFFRRMNGSIFFLVRMLKGQNLCKAAVEAQAAAL